MAHRRNGGGKGWHQRTGRRHPGVEIRTRAGARLGGSMVTVGEKLCKDGSWVGEDTGVISEGCIVCISRGSGRKFSGEN